MTELKDKGVMNLVKKYSFKYRMNKKMHLVYGYSLMLLVCQVCKL